MFVGDNTNKGGYNINLVGDNAMKSNKKRDQLSLIPCKQIILF